jgi:hypothetical protein
MTAQPYADCCGLPGGEEVFGGLVEARGDPAEPLDLEHPPAKWIPVGGKADAKRRRVSARSKSIRSVCTRVEEALDEVARLAELLREADRVFPVAPWRNVRRGLPVGDGGPHETQGIWRRIGFRAGFGRSPQAWRQKRKGGPKAAHSITKVTNQIMSGERTIIVSKLWNA